MTQRFAHTFAADPRDVAAARRFASDTLGQWGMASPEVNLVVGELGANAVLHAHSPFTVALSLFDHRVVVEVTDEGQRLPMMTAAPTEALSGRGMVIIERLAANWGVRAEPEHGKTVWVEFDADEMGEPELVVEAPALPNAS